MGLLRWARTKSLAIIGKAEDLQELSAHDLSTDRATDQFPFFLLLAGL
jgi:hypothetical protein